MKLRSLVAPLIAVSFTVVNPCEPPKDLVKEPVAVVDETVHDVRTIMPSYQSIPRVYAVNGVVDYPQVYKITATATAHVDQLFAAEGQFVNRDDPLVMLSSQDVNDQLDLKRLKLREYQARLADAQARLGESDQPDGPVEPADAEFLDEEQPPTDSAAEPTPQPTPDQTPQPKQQRTAATLKTLIDVLNAAIERTGKEIELIEAKLLALTINAPVSGMVAKRLVSPGALVTEAATIYEIVQTEPLVVTFQLPQEEASVIAKSETVQVSPVDAPAVTTVGLIDTVAPQIDLANHQIAVRAAIQNPDQAIKAGQTVTVTVKSTQTDRMIVLPKTAVRAVQDKHYVFVVFKGRAQSQIVDVSPINGDTEHVQVSGNLRVDDPIIVDPPEGLVDQSVVKIVDGE